MKFIVTSILTLLLSQICFSQKADTIRIYNYLKQTDRWILKIKNNKSFTLYTNQIFTKDDIILTGLCKIDDTTIQFICDTSKPKIKNLTRDILKQFSNIPFILCGDKFPKQNNFFIPRNINYVYEGSAIMPKGIYASYYRGDGYGSNSIELKQDGTYIFSDNSCLAHSTEKGTWTINNEIITFSPDNKNWSSLEWVTKDRQVYLTENYLIGKKTTETVTKTKKTIVTETFFFLSKEPTYLSD